MASQLRVYTINRGRLDDFVAAWRGGASPPRPRVAVLVAGARGLPPPAAAVRVSRRRGLGNPRAQSVRLDPELRWPPGLGGRGRRLLRIAAARRPEPRSGPVDRPDQTLVF